MFGRDEIRRARLFSSVLLILVFRSRAGGQDEPLRIAAGGSAIETTLRDAARKAEEKLAEAPCRVLFSDFRSLRGRTLQQVLDSLGHTGQTYFRALLFYDGSGRVPCASPATIAFTSPGSRAVFLCASNFLATAHRDSGYASALLIHEELHALGLGENPPTSGEITARVVARCGK